MNKQEFNRLAAEFLKFPYETHGEAIFAMTTEFDSLQEFNPYDDANDLCMLEDKLKIYTSPDNNMWCSEMNPSSEKRYRVGYGKTPHESRRSCAEEYLKEKYNAI